MGSSDLEKFDTQLVQLTQEVSNIRASAFDPRDGLDQLIKTVDKVVDTLKDGRVALAPFRADDDIEWVYEAREGVQSVKTHLEDASGMMAHLMDLLESHPHRDDKRQWDVVGKIEQAIKEWCDVLPLVDSLRNQAAVSVEWKELNDAIFTDLVEELETCDILVFKITQALARIDAATNRSNENELDINNHIDVDLVSTAMAESPLGNNIRLLSLSNSDREMNQDFIELQTRLDPLRASLNVLPERITQYKVRASEFPSSFSALRSKLVKVNKRFKQVEAKAKEIEEQLQGRWSGAFAAILHQCNEDFEQVKQNLEFIGAAEFRAHKGLKVDRIKMDRLAKQNGYIIPSMAKALALLHRAITDKLCTDLSLESRLSQLHTEWINLLTQSSAVDDSTASPQATRQQQQNENTIVRASEEGSPQKGSSPSFLKHMQASMQRTPPPKRTLHTSSLFEPSTPTPAPYAERSFIGADIMPLRGLAIKTQQRRHSKVSSASSTGSTGSVKIFSPSITATSSFPSSPETENDDLTLSGLGLVPTHVAKPNNGRLLFASAATSSGPRPAPPKTRKSARNITPTSHLPVLSPEFTRTKRAKMQQTLNSPPILKRQTSSFYDPSTLTAPSTPDIHALMPSFASPSKIPRPASRLEPRVPSRQGSRQASNTPLVRSVTPSELSDSLSNLSIKSRPSLSPPNRAKSSLGLRTAARAQQRVPKRKVSTPILNAVKPGPIESSRPWKG